MADGSQADAALRHLVAPGLSIVEAEQAVPSHPGLYAVHADPPVWRSLGLGAPPDERPLYVGKAERSLADRDVRTHFSTGRTGSSTLRRSLAGLLADELRLEARPRNLAHPEGFANFGLEAQGDERLTRWMFAHLRLAVWPAPEGAVLDVVETAVLERLLPPLNVAKVKTLWRAQVQSGRKRLAQQAKAWSAIATADAVDLNASAPGDTAPPTRGTARALGIDAAGDHGWLGVVIDDGGFRGARLGSIEAIIEWAEPVEVIGIDIPIGHVAGGLRRADVEVRHFVGPRGSSVFPAPPAEAHAASSYAEANVVLTAMGAPRMSKQAWSLLPKMVEAAGVAATDRRVHEVHPEVSFCELGGQCLAWPKKSWNGLLGRRRLLADAGIQLPDLIADAGGAMADDVVDAAVAAWSARRIAVGSARTFPDPPQEVDGRKVAIWC